MAQLERMQRDVDTGKNSSNPTVERLFRGAEVSKVLSPTSSSSSSPSSPYFERMKHHDLEEDHGNHQKKSVLTKVKEKARKLRHSLSKKRHEDGNVTPSWGVTLEEDIDEEGDPEYLGAPMYESELAPEAYKENARQHPRATPVISEKHVLPSTTVKPGVEQERERAIVPNSRRTIRTATTNPLSPKRRTPETVAEKPVYTTRSDAADSIAAKVQGIGISEATKYRSSSATATAPAARIQGIAVSKPLEHQSSSAPATTAKRALSTFSAPNTPGNKMASQSFSVTTVVPKTSSAPVTPQNSSTSLKNTSPSDQIWDKGVSVKEYLLNKFEPGEDEKALSQVISEAMSPGRTPGDVGVMEKVREAVTSLLRNEEPSKYAVKSPASTIPSSTSSQIPVSTTVYEVHQDENHGRILQTN